MLCRVLMGNINYCDLAFPGDGGPSKNQFNISDLVNGVINGEYHSVLGDREKCRRTFREFIVYDNAQVYIEWIIWYKREMSPGSMLRAPEASAEEEEEEEEEEDGDGVETRSAVISSLSGTNIKAHFQTLLDNTWIPIWTRDRKRNGGVMPLAGPYR